MSSIRLGTTYPPTDIETVLSTTQLTGKREPRTRFYEASFSTGWTATSRRRASPGGLDL